MMMTMYNLHSTPNCRHLLTKAAPQTSMDGADCCLIGIVLGVTVNRNIPQ